MMRRLLALLISLTAARLGALEGEWQQRASVSFDTSYVRRGIEQAGASVRPAWQLSDERWSFDVWANAPFCADDEREAAMRIGYSHDFGANLKLDWQVAHYRFERVGAEHANHATEAGVALTLPAGPGRIGVGLIRDVERRANYVEMGYAGEIALKKLGAFLNYRFFAGWVQADDVLPRSAVRVADAYSYHGVEVAVPYRVGSQTIVTLGARYAGTWGARPFWSPTGASPKAGIALNLAVSHEF